MTLKSTASGYFLEELAAYLPTNTVNDNQGLIISLFQDKFILTAIGFSISYIPHTKLWKYNDLNTQRVGYGNSLSIAANAALSAPVTL